MKFIKKLLILLIVFTGINLVTTVSAANIDLEVFYFCPGEDLEDIEMELRDLDDNLLNTLNKDRALVNGVTWYKFYLNNYDFSEDNYLLNVTLASEGTSFTIDLEADHNYLVGNTFTFYLRENTLKRSLEDLRTVVSYATFSNRTEIKFTTNFKVDESEVKVLINDTYYDDFELKIISGQNFIILNDDLDFKKEYYINIIPKDGQAPSTEAVRFDDVYDEGFFISSFAYSGDDLGATHSPTSTTFKIWAPTLNNMTLNLYNSQNVKESLQMTEENYGVYTYTKRGNLENYGYTFSFTRFGVRHEIIDPYAKFTENNKGVIIDLKKTNPAGFNNFKPASSSFYGDAIIYESTINQITNKLSETHLRGKFNGLYEKTNDLKIFGINYTTGMEHLKELGITHLVLSDLIKTNNSLSVINNKYQTNSSLTSGLKELKQAIKTLSDNGINVLYDLNIYNEYIPSLELLMPGYYYEVNNSNIIRSNDNKSFFNTNRYMTNKYICSQVLYLMEEFKFSGLKLTPLNSLNIDHINNLWRNIETLEENFLLYGEFIDEYPSNADGKLTFDKLEQVRQVGFIDENRFSIDEEDFLTSTGTNSLKSYLLSYWSSSYNIIEPFQSFKRLPHYDELSSGLNRQIKAVQLLSYGVPVIKAGEELNIFDGSPLSYEEKHFNNSIFTIYKNLLAFRKEHHSLKFKDHSTIKNTVLYDVIDDLVYYRIINPDDLYPDMLVIHNFGEDTSFMLPEGLPEKSHYNRDGEFNWQIAFDNLNNYYLSQPFDGKSEIEVKKNQSVILHFGLNKYNIITDPIPSPELKYPVNILYYLIIGGGVVILLGIGATYFILRSARKETD